MSKFGLCAKIHFGDGNESEGDYFDGISCASYEKSGTCHECAIAVSQFQLRKELRIKMEEKKISSDSPYKQVIYEYLKRILANVQVCPISIQYFSILIRSKFRPRLLAKEFKCITMSSLCMARTSCATSSETSGRLRSSTLNCSSSAPCRALRLV